MNAMLRFFKTITLVLLLLLGACSAEDGQDGIAGRDGEDGKNGVNGVDGVDGVGASIIDLGWGIIANEQWGPRTEEVSEISLEFPVPIMDITATQLESFAIFGFLRFPIDPTIKYALPTLLRDDDTTTVDYEIVIGGFSDTNLFFTLRTEDGSLIPIDAEFSELEIKFILAPANIGVTSANIETYLYN